MGDILIPRYEVAPPGYTETELYENTIPKIGNLHTRVLYSQIKLRVYEQEDIEVGMTYYGNVWSMCTKNILMIDFDYKAPTKDASKTQIDGEASSKGHSILTRDKAFDMLRKYTDHMHSLGIDLLFETYDTDRGLHAFLVNIKMDYLSQNAMNVMIDLHNDADYIAFVKIRGFCIRIGPKFPQPPSGYVGNETDYIQQAINKEFVAKPVEGTNAFIGYGEPLEYISNVLRVHLSLIRWFSQQYKERLQELRSKRYIEESDKYDYCPPKEFLDEVKAVTVHLLTQAGLKREETEYTVNIPYVEREFPRRGITVYSQNGLSFYYDLYNSIWVMCTNNILMIDIDEEHGSSKKEIVERISKYTSTPEGSGYLFWIYETDKGIHAFVVNKYISNTSPEAQTIMSALGDDPNHMKFVMVGAHCVRLSPKIYRNGKVQDRDTILKEFISRRCYSGSCVIGKGIPIQYIKNVLLVQDHVISYLKSLYIEHYDDMTISSFSNQINMKTIKPSEHTIQMVRDMIMSIMTDFNMLRNDLTYKDNDHRPNVSRYTDLADDKLISVCGSATLSDIKKMGQDLASKYNIIRCRNRTVGICGPEVPFDFYRDNGSNLLILVMYDIAVLDFDVKDGSPKHVVPYILKRFIASQRTLPEDDRVTKSGLCFKLYETDNGVHAWCVSHFLPFYTQQSTRLQLETCSDKYYAGFSSRNGHSTRMSPKVFTDSVNRIPATEESVGSQFIQKEGVYVPEENARVLYIGDTKNINPYIEEFVDLVYSVQTYIKSIPNIVTLMKNYDDTVLYDVSRLLRNKFLSMNNKRDERYARQWAVDTLNCSIYNRGRYTEIYPEKTKI